MHDATMQGSPRKKFNKIRELNRRRNYFTKKVRNALRVGVAKALWDRRRRQPVDLSSAKTVLLMRNEGAVGDVVVDSALVKCLHQSGYIVDFLLTTSNSQVMRYNPRIRHIYEADPVTSADFLRKFNHNVPRDVINELANNKYDIIIDPSLFDIPVHRLRLFRQIKAKSVLGFNKWPSIKHYSHSFDLTAALARDENVRADRRLSSTGHPRAGRLRPGGARADYAGGGAVSGVAKRKSGGD